MQAATDLKLHWDPWSFEGDIAMGSAGDLETGDLLEAAVLISLLTWRRATDDDDVSDYGGDRMGWWGDSYAPNTGDLIGSRLWLLRRSKITPDLLPRVREICEEALEWVIEDGVAARVTVQVVRRGLDTIVVTVTLARDDGTERVLRYDNIWEALNA